MMKCRLLIVLLAFISSESRDDDYSCALENDGSCLEESASLDQCTLYMAPSTIPNAGIGIFTAIPLAINTTVGYGDVVLPLIDVEFHVGANFFNPFDEYIWDGLSMGMELESHTLNVGAYAPGLDCAINCHLGLLNVDRELPEYDTTLLGHRSTSPSAGSMTPYHNVRTYTTSPIPPGGELFKYYGDHWFETRPDVFGKIPLKYDYRRAEKLLRKLRRLEEKFHLSVNILHDIHHLSTHFPFEGRVLNALPREFKTIDTVLHKGMRSFFQPNATRTVQELRATGRCLDNIRPGPSTLAHAGRGAFAARDLSAGTVITGSPVLHFPNREVVHMYDSYYDEEEEDNVRDTSKLITQQLVVNYCMGHAESSMLLCPYGSGVGYINHNQSLANIRLTWAPHGQMGHDETWLSMPPPMMEWIYEPHLSLDYIATRDIQQGEELFLDYGDLWEEAWQQHLQEWEVTKGDQTYVSASQWNAQHGESRIRTESEQVTDPYPSNLWIRCHSQVWDEDEPWKSKHLKSSTSLAWPLDEKGYTCRILNRTREANDSYTYEIELEGDEGPEYRDKVTRSMISFVDATGTTDLQMPNAFRHDMGIPDELVPEAWRNT